MRLGCSEWLLLDARSGTVNLQNWQSESQGRGGRLALSLTGMRSAFATGISRYRVAFQRLPASQDLVPSHPPSQTGRRRRTRPSLLLRLSLCAPRARPWPAGNHPPATVMWGGSMWGPLLLRWSSVLLPARIAGHESGWSSRDPTPPHCRYWWCSGRCGRRGSAGELVLAVWRLPEPLGTAAARQLKVLQRRQGGRKTPCWPRVLATVRLWHIGPMCAGPEGRGGRASHGLPAQASARRRAPATYVRARAAALGCWRPPPLHAFCCSQRCHAQVTAVSIRRAQAAQAVAACLARQAFHWLPQCNYCASISFPAVRSACSSSSCSAACRGGLGISAVGPHGRSLYVLPLKLCTAAKPL